jgi:hypothetical protein
MVFRCVERRIGANYISSARLMRAVFLAAIQRGSLLQSLLLLFFAQLPPLVELLAALSWTVALAVVIA